MYTSGVPIERWRWVTNQEQKWRRIFYGTVGEWSALELVLVLQDTEGHPFNVLLCFCGRVGGDVNDVFSGGLRYLNLDSKTATSYSNVLPPSNIKLIKYNNNKFECYMHPQYNYVTLGIGRIMFNIRNNGTLAWDNSDTLYDSLPTDNVRQVLTAIAV